MESFFAMRMSAQAIAITGLLNFIWIWTLHRQWWRYRWVRHALWIVPIAGLLSAGFWAFAMKQAWIDAARAGSVITVVFFLISIAFTLTLPLSGIVLSIARLVRWVLMRGKQRMDESVAAQSSVPAEVVALPEDRSRRDFIVKAATVIPLVAVSASMRGLVQSTIDVRMPNVELFFSDLPASLDGFRILHVSDTHLSYYIQLDDIERMMIAAEGENVDMTLVTGDISDYLPELPETLRLIDALKPKYGTFGSLGNHEYYRGIDEVLRSFDHGPIPLLKDSGALITVGDSQLYVGGADDPVSMRDGRRNEYFLKGTVDRAFDGAPSDAFKLLMSHRPEGFDAAGERGIHLTVAGHTHAGGQMGWNGKSVIEKLFGARYQWGHYQKPSGSQLYTSAGAGHWFPFRLGVPREAPVYILRRGNSA